MSPTQVFVLLERFFPFVSPPNLNSRTCSFPSSWLVSSVFRRDSREQRHPPSSLPGIPYLVREVQTPTLTVSFFHLTPGTFRLVAGPYPPSLRPNSSFRSDPLPYSFGMVPFSGPPNMVSVNVFSWHDHFPPAAAPLRAVQTTVPLTSSLRCTLLLSPSVRISVLVFEASSVFEESELLCSAPLYHSEPTPTHLQSPLYSVSWYRPRCLLWCPFGTHGVNPGDSSSFCGARHPALSRSFVRAFFAASPAVTVEAVSGFSICS